LFPLSDAQSDPTGFVFTMFAFRQFDYAESGGFGRLSFVVVLVTLLSSLGEVRGQGSESPASEAVTPAQAAEFLQAVAESLAIEPEASGQQRPMLRKTPVFKYSDPTRGYLAAGVWRLGDTGRPAALLTLQHSTQADTGQPRLDFELLSLGEARFRVSSGQVSLGAEGSPPAFARFAGAPKPASSESQRLLQLRSLARRFKVSEKYVEDTAALRLLPQPIDRYRDPARGIVDGGLFVFAYGANPEALLILECDDEGWRYALARLAWAELVIELDGAEVARFEQLGSPPVEGPYRTAGHVIEPDAAKTQATGEAP
jgi:hypothetical protein